MVDNVGGVSPENKAIYKDQFERGLNLFEKSLNQYQSAEGHKKEVFKDVMDKALNIMNETAKAGLGKTGADKEKNLEKDYNNYIASESPDALDKLNNDINNLKGIS